jgi:hypothetical protein
MITAGPLGGSLAAAFAVFQPQEFLLWIYQTILVTPTKNYPAFLG